MITSELGGELPPTGTTDFDPNLFDVTTKSEKTGGI